MFTGLVQSVGRVLSAEKSEAGVRLRVDAAPWGHAPQPGDSICVSGCCLTLAEARSGSVLTFDVVAETLSKTTLGQLAPGSSVNLEHSCTPATLMGGHIVQGHVDGVAAVTSVQDDPSDWRVEFQPPAELMPFIVPKGSIAVEGVSLTIARVGAESFGVALIPTTLDRTTLRALRPGGRVNIETDMIAKTIVHYMRNFGR
ncbi:MAG: riboflavin synthase [Planctomycetota bacterium]|nr:riboflavin synthase [Planctomycetota bacterium]